MSAKRVVRGECHAGRCCNCNAPLGTFHAYGCIFNRVARLWRAAR